MIRLSRWMWLGAFLAGLAALAVVVSNPSRGGDGKAPKGWQPPPTEFECRFTELPVKIDGKGDDDPWKHAQTIDNFYLPWLGDKARPAKTKTTAKLLWDRENLYFLAVMEDADLFADLTENNGRLWENDVFELFFRPADDKPGYYEFQVNAANAVLNMFLPRREAGNYERYKKDSHFQIDAKVHLRGTLNKRIDRDEGWSVEGKIPWTDFFPTGGRPELNEKWKFALGRYDYTVGADEPELSTCAPLKSKATPDFHLIEDYATLRFVRAEKSAWNYGIEERIPLTTSKVVGSPDPPLPFKVVRAFPELKIDFPICITHQPLGDRLLFIYQQASYGPTEIGRIKGNRKATAKDVETLLKLTDTAYDIVFHPKFSDNGYFYVGSNGSLGGGPKKTRVTRYVMERREPYKVDPASAKIIIEWDSDGHNGAAMAFGHDGMFYVTSGDGTSDSDTKIVGQDMSSLLAKVLRIDIDHPDAGREYSVPKDNPFLDMKGARPEIWAVGLRNPWRMTVDKKTGHLWVGQNGQDLWEQAYLVKKGENYGWSVMEGSHEFYPNRKPGPLPFVKPTIEHHHSEFRSLTGGVVYYGKKYPELNGAYIYGDYSTGRIWAMKHDGTKPLWHKELCDSRLQITGFGIDVAGEILIADHRKELGGFYTLSPLAPQGRGVGGEGTSTFPHKLSESGLFRSVKGHVMESALIPYSVNAVLWSDNAFKERWLGIPGEGKIDFTTPRGWNFPDETVIVKSFGLEMEEGNPASKRWVETRFLTRQAGEWFGYSYAWNDAQTEGVLVEKAGLDHEYVIKTPTGFRKQIWHFPSRAECMVCHSRAANWVLGLTEAQMNRDFTYDKATDNQLRTFEHIGLFNKFNWHGDARAIVLDEAKKKGMSEEKATEYVEKLCATKNQRKPVASSLFTVAPEKRPHLVDPYDKKQDVAHRARSYLHANCAHCHVDAGGGNAQIDLEFTTPLDKMRVLNVKPQHDTFALPDARLIVPGHPEKSVLLHRIANRDKGFMPPLATRLVDRETVELMREWIMELEKKPAK